MQTLNEDIFEPLMPDARVNEMGEDNVLRPMAQPTSYIPPVMAARWNTLQKRRDQIKAAFAKKDEEVIDFLKINMDRSPRTGVADKTAYKKMHLQESLFEDSCEDCDDQIVEDEEILSECDIMQEDATGKHWTREQGMEYETSPTCYRMFIEAPNPKDPDGNPIFLLNKCVKKVTGLYRELENFNALKDSVYKDANYLYIQKYADTQTARADIDGATVNNDGIVYIEQKNDDGNWEVVQDNFDNEYSPRYRRTVINSLVADLGTFGANDKYSEMMKRLRRLGNDEMKGKRFKSEKEMNIGRDGKRVILNSKNLVKFDWAKKVANEYGLLFTWVNPGVLSPTDAPKADRDKCFWAAIDTTVPVAKVSEQELAEEPVAETPVDTEPVEDAAMTDAPVDEALNVKTANGGELSLDNKTQQAKQETLRQLLNTLDSTNAKNAEAGSKVFGDLIDGIKTVISEVANNADKIGDGAGKIGELIAELKGFKV